MGSRGEQGGARAARRAGLLRRAGALGALVVALAAPPAVAAPAHDVAALRARLGGTDAAAATAAALALGAARAPAALDALLDALALGLPPPVAAAALDAAGRQASERAVVVLLAYARHRSPALRAHALSALAQVPSSPAADQALLAALGDEDAGVRAEAGRLLAARRDGRAVAPLLALLGRGDEAAGPPLAALATADTARAIAELSGQVPDALVARTLGAAALRSDLGPEATYVGVVRALAALPGPEAREALRAVAAAAPAPRAARKEAEAILAARAAP